MVDLEKVREDLVSIARDAGKTILDRSGRVSHENKKNAVDLVTEVDQAVEAMVSSRLQQMYPEFSFMGEETFKVGDTLGPEPTFIVDPIDGTTNFYHFFPNACISLGLAVDREPVVGVVFNPFTDQLFTGVKGHGAYLNGDRLPLRPPPEPLSLQGSLCAIEWGSDRDGANYEIKTRTFDSLASKEGGFVHGFRSMGSAALNLCGVAAGYLDSYWEGGCWAWDVCAGWVILSEAGGRMVGGVAEEWDIPVTRRVYLGVRAAPKKEQDGYISSYWEHIKGNLEYEH